MICLWSLLIIIYSVEILDFFIFNDWIFLVVWHRLWKLTCKWLGSLEVLRLYNLITWWYPWWMSPEVCIRVFHQNLVWSKTLIININWLSKNGIVYTLELFWSSDCIISRRNTSSHLFNIVIHISISFCRRVLLATQSTNFKWTYNFLFINTGNIRL